MRINQPAFCKHVRAFLSNFAIANFFYYKILVFLIIKKTL